MVELTVLLVSHAALLNVLWLGDRLLAVLWWAWVSFVKAASMVLLIKTFSGLGIVVAAFCLVVLNWLEGLCGQGLEWSKSILRGYV
jgi:hypothetical protein